MGVGSFPCNVVQALARCAEPCSLGRAAPGGAEGIPGGHGSTSLCGQLSPDLLGQQESSIRITELMIKENSNHQRETSAAGGSRCLSRELSGCFGAEGVLRPGKKGPQGSSCDIFRTVISGLHRPHYLGRRAFFTEWFPALSCQGLFLSFPLWSAERALEAHELGLLFFALLRESLKGCSLLCSSPFNNRGKGEGPFQVKAPL